MKIARTIGLLLCLCLILCGCSIFTMTRQIENRKEPIVDQPVKPTEPQAALPSISVIYPVQEETEPAEPNDPLLDSNRQLVNVFLSNFAEQHFPGYRGDDNSKVRFALPFAKINKSSVVKMDGDVYYINEADMDVIIYDYFGTSLMDHGEPWAYYYDNGALCATYRNGRYEYPAADGANYDSLAIATSMTSLGDGYYAVEFNTYSIPYGIDRSYYSMTVQELEATGLAQYTGQGHAVIREHIRTSGKESYLLDFYELY